MNRPVDIVAVDLDTADTRGPTTMGTLRRQLTRTGAIVSFDHDPRWIARADAFVFDPDLALVVGAQYPPQERANFGIFLDSSPDRWGRTLMQRRENARARRDGDRPRALTEWDFLLGVHDETRLGALRFRAPETNRYLDDDAALAAPPLTSLRDLQAASLRYEQHADDESHPASDAWLAQLFAPGTSLGGARPKATVRDETGALCIAKFPSRQDARDVGAWEIVAHRLAAKAGVIVPPSRLLRFADSDHATFIARRFDRAADQTRVAFVSAMTLTQRRDGEDGASYLELVDLLQARGADTARDCAQLFRRIVFSIAIHNTDDHLRNHGFFVGSTGIRLSPAFDINPSIDGTALTLAIDELDTACDFGVALDACAYYGLSRADADAVVAEVRAAVATWRDEASRAGIPRADQQRMAPAFDA